MANTPNKTQETALSVFDFIAGVEPAQRRADAEALFALMERATGETAKMWGPSIVGFGVRHYRYESGREGSICKVGFSPRKAALTLYGLGSLLEDPAMAALGKFTTGKGCVYVKAMSDIDGAALEGLVRRAYTAEG